MLATTQKRQKKDKVGQMFDKLSHRVETHYVGVGSKLKSEKRYQRLRTKDRVEDENNKMFKSVTGDFSMVVLNVMK